MIRAQFDLSASSPESGGMASTNATARTGSIMPKVSTTVGLAAFGSSGWPRAMAGPPGQAQ
jgi:hypothetical protein